MTHRNETLVHPTTAYLRPQFFALCTTCGWQVHTPLFASAEALADAHSDRCETADIWVDLVRYIGGNHEGEAGL